MRISRWMMSIAAITASVAFNMEAANAGCGFPAFQGTLAEQLERADVSVIAKWVSAKRLTKRTYGPTTFEISRVVKTSKTTVKVGTRISLIGESASKPGTWFLLHGKLKGGRITWRSAGEFNKRRLAYLLGAPSPKASAKKRVVYYSRFLESSDSTIADDAYAEFRNYRELVAHAKLLPRKLLARHIADKSRPGIRLTHYGVMLGLCGNAEDAKLLEQRVFEKLEKDSFRLGADGLIAGYLLLHGEPGLVRIEKAFLRNTDQLFSEKYATFAALKIVDQLGRKEFSRKRIIRSMHLLIEDPMGELVVDLLQHWKDWSQQDRLMRLYGRKPYDEAGMKRVIIRYIYASTKDRPKRKGGKLPTHVVKGRKYLELLKKKDPKTYADAARFNLPPFDSED